MIRAATAQEKQGDLPHLAERTKVELVDLLARQEKILRDKKFLSKLEDKGVKVKRFACRLRELIAEKEEVESAMRLFEQMDLGQEGVIVTDVTERVPSFNDHKSGVIGVNLRTEQEVGPPRTKPYVKTMSSATAKLDKKEKFKPNRHLKSTTIPEDMPRPLVRMKTQAHDSGKGSEIGDKKDEFTSAKLPPLRNHEAQVVDLEESANLLQEQKKNAEALLAKQAADKLMERLNLKMGDFIPEVEKASYRDQVDDSNDESEGSSDGSDEDNEEQDNS